MGLAGRLEPGVQAEHSAEAPAPTTRSGNGTADKNRQFTVLQEVKKLGKMVLRELGLVEGRVIGANMNYNSLDGSWQRF